MRCSWSFSGDKSELARCGNCGREVNLTQFSYRQLDVPCGWNPRATSITSVVIISHNYGRFLAEAIHSVLAQTLKAKEILVIDDGSTDETLAVANSFADRGVRYLRVDTGFVYKNRLIGLNNTDGRYLVFLDADDMFPANYIEAGEQAMKSDRRVGIVYTDCDLFGEETGTVVYNPKNIECENYIHATSMVSREAMESVEWSTRDNGSCTHDDWYMWRQIIRMGWGVVKSPANLRYRKHGQSMMRTNMNRYNYYQFASLRDEEVQIVIPLSGRKKWLPRIKNWVKNQTWKSFKLLVTDTSSDPEFRKEVKKWLSALDVEYTYVPLSGTNGLADLERRDQFDTVRAVQKQMVLTYSQISQRMQNEYIFWLEDDVLPPLDAISRLMKRMDFNVACVSGVVASRFAKQYIAWSDRHRTPITKPTDGLEHVYGTGFGCLLVRGSVLSSILFRGYGLTHNYDNEFSFDVNDAGWKWMLDWDVQCWHQDIPPGKTVEPPPLESSDDAEPKQDSDPEARAENGVLVSGESVQQIRGWN